MKDFCYHISRRLSLRSFLLNLRALSFLLPMQGFATPAVLDVDSFSTTNFTGTSSAAGTTIIITNGGTVNFQDQSTAANASISIDGTSQLNFAQSVATTYSGLLSGTGTVIKSGSGALTLTGNNGSFTGPLLVEVDTIILDGSYGGSIIASPGTNVIYGGPISGDLTVNGGVITTQGIKTLSIGGNYSQINSAIYLARVNPEGQSTLLDIGGTATISNSFVQVDTSNGVLFHHAYTILHAAGGITGTYSLFGSYPGLAVFLTQDSTNVYLSFDPNFISVAKTPNQRRVATQLDGLTSFTADEDYVLGVLSSLSASEQREALDAMSGEQYTTFIPALLYADEAFSTRIFDAYRSLWDECLKHCNHNPHYWLSVTHGGGTQKSTRATPGFHLKSDAVNAGIHSFFGNSWFFGGALGYERDKLEEVLPGHADLHTNQAAVYSAYRANKFYVRGDLIGGWTWSHYRRIIKFGTLDRKAHSTPRIIHGRIDVEVGTDWGGCPFFAEPFFGLSGEVYHQNRMHEHRAQSLNLVIDAKSKYFMSSMLGVRLNGNFKKKTLLGLDLVWQHYYGNLRVNTKTHFADFGNSFSIEGPKRGHDGAGGSLYLSTTIGKCFEIYFKSTGQLWKNWKSYEFDGGIHF